MTKEKLVTIEMDIRSAAEIRQVLYEHQKGHSYDFASERITNIRRVIIDLDDKIGALVSEQ